MNYLIYDMMFPTDEKKMKFMRKCILTFGLRLETVKDIFKIEDPKIDEKYFSYGLSHSILSEALDFVLTKCCIVQDVARSNFEDFFWTFKRSI